MQVSRTAAFRALSTTVPRFAELPEPNAIAATSIPLVTPRNGGISKLSTPTPASIKAAQGIKNITGHTTETYTAYGATEILEKECARQADYTIKKTEDEDVPKTADGVDLGVGGGWWHTGVLKLTLGNPYIKLTTMQNWAFQQHSQHGLK